MRALLFLLALGVAGLASSVFAEESSTAAASSAPAESAAAPAPAPAPASDDDEGLDITPFYSFQWVEGLVLPSVGTWFAPANFGTSLGAKYQVAAEHALFGVYDLQYDGPGLRYQEGRNFQERAIDHNVLGEYQWSGISRHTIKTRVLFIKELRRSGSSEKFGSGLYDFWVLGGGVLDEFAWRKGVVLGGGLTYQYFRFPNYSDLFQEFASGDASPESLGGQYDYQNVRLNGEARFRGKGRITASVASQMYVKQPVLEVVPPYGLSTKKQRDLTGDVGGSWTFGTGEGSRGKGTVTPGLRVAIKTSNQNYVKRDLTASSTDFTGVLAIKDYYSNVSAELNVPARWTFSGGTALQFAVRWMPAFYTSRPAQDADGNYLTGKMSTHPVTLTPSVMFPMSKLVRWTLGLTYAMKSSNNKFERYLPYNYSGTFLFSSVDIVY